MQTNVNSTSEITSTGDDQHQVGSPRNGDRHSFIATINIITIKYRHIATSDTIKIEVDGSTPTKKAQKTKIELNLNKETTTTLDRLVKTITQTVNGE